MLGTGAQVLVVDDAVEQWTERGLHGGVLRTHHAAAHHRRPKGMRAERADQLDRVPEIGTEEQQVAARRGHRIQDRREVRRVERVGLFMDDRKSVPLGIRSGAVQRIARELGIRCHERHGHWPRRLRSGDGEEPFRQARVRVWAGGDHRKVARIRQVAVHPQSHQPDKEPATVNDQWHRRSQRVRPIATDDQVDLVVVQQAPVQPLDPRSIRPVVVTDQLDGPPQEATGPVDVLAPDLMRESGGLSISCQRTGQRQAVPDPNR